MARSCPAKHFCNCVQIGGQSTPVMASAFLACDVVSSGVAGQGWSGLVRAWLVRAGLDRPGKEDTGFA